MSLSDSNPDLKVTPLFDAEHLINVTRYNGIGQGFIQTPRDISRIWKVGGGCKIKVGENFFSAPPKWGANTTPWGVQTPPYLTSI